MQYIVLAQELRRAPSEQGVCDALATARPLALSLGAHLTKARETSLAQPDDSGASPEALQAQLKELSDALPGVRVVMGAERIYRFVDYTAIAELAPKDSAASRLLQATGELWSPLNGWPAFIEQQTDVSGCTQLGELRGRLEPLLGQWQGAPQCVQEALLESINQAVDQAASSQCFCTDKPTTLREAETLAPLLSAEPLKASGARGALHETITSPDARFECQAG